MIYRLTSQVAVISPIASIIKIKKTAKKTAMTSRTAFAALLLGLALSSQAMSSRALADACPAEVVQQRQDMRQRQDRSAVVQFIASKFEQCSS